MAALLEPGPTWAEQMLQMFKDAAARAAQDYPELRQQMVSTPTPTAEETLAREAAAVEAALMEAASGKPAEPAELPGSLTGPHPG